MEKSQQKKIILAKLEEYIRSSYLCDRGPVFVKDLFDCYNRDFDMHLNVIYMYIQDLFTLRAEKETGTKISQICEL